MKPTILKAPETLTELITDFKETNARAKNTWKVYANAVSILKKFLGEKYGSEDLALREFNVALITRFRLWMSSQPRRNWVNGTRAMTPVNTCLDQNTILLYVTKITSLFRYADRMEYLVYPFRNYYPKIETFMKIGVHLLDRKVSKTHLQLLENVTTVLNYNIERYRLLFLLQRWTGMSWVDLRHNPDLRKLIRLSDEKEVLVYNRVKTKELAIVPLFDPSRELMKKMGYDTNPGPYNQYLGGIKRMFDFFEIDSSDVGTHTGRHVFGSEMLEMGFSMEAVSRMMGHHGIEETQNVYAKINQQKIFADLNRIHAHEKAISDRDF